LVILVTFTAAEFILLLAQGFMQKRSSGVVLPVHGSRSIQPLSLLRHREPILLKENIIKPSFTIILVKGSCLYLIYFKTIMTNKVILDQNLNAGLKILPQERQAAEFKLTTLRG
jgi:hypothetical protein